MLLMVKNDTNWCRIEQKQKKKTTHLIRCHFNWNELNLDLKIKQKKYISLSLLFSGKQIENKIKHNSRE